MAYTVYILQSKIKDRFYIGVTKNLEERVRKHNKGGTRSTNPYRPWQIIYSELLENKEDAYKREYFLKHPKGFLEKKRIIELNRK